MKRQVVLFATAVILPLAALAQAGAPASARELRVGAVGPGDSRDALTDGGLRTISNGQTFAVPASLAKDYRIGANDLLEVEVLDAENLRRTVRVSAGGAVSLPLIGHVQIGGLTPHEAEEKIATRYSEKFLQNPQVSILIREYTTERVTIEGAVVHPGIFPLTGQLTLLRALAVAGGFGPIANMSQVLVYRTNDSQVRESKMFDVQKIRAGEAEDPAIRGDDLIVVQRDSTRAVLKDSLLRDILDSINPFSVLAPR
jgi:polysaccharide export outer membrane protein